jgi:hypothetical protein
MPTKAISAWVDEGVIIHGSNNSKFNLQNTILHWNIPHSFHGFLKKMFALYFVPPKSDLPVKTKGYYKLPLRHRNCMLKERYIFFSKKKK